MAEGRSAAEILALLDQRKAEAAGSEELKRGYRRAAAVLVSLTQPDDLQPVGGRGAPGEGVRLLRSELIPATGRKFGGRLMLHPNARKSAIRELPTDDLRQDALNANPRERDGTIQRQLESYLFGNALPIEQQSDAELETTLQVATWLFGAVESVPDPTQVQALLKWRGHTAIFEALAGDSIFQGRRKELDQLRSYVGVLEPAALLRRLAGKALNWARPEKRPAVSISGPGGVGKSALVARFMLEHTRLPAEARIPFAYLDFDRASLNISEPGTLLGEMLRQIDLQFAQEGYFGKIREFFAERMGTGERDEATSGHEYEKRIQSVIVDLVGSIDHFLGPRPYVVVLDTFEEVQYRGESKAYPFWELLDFLQKARPFLRLIVTGRAPVYSVVLGGQSPYQIELGDLDDAAAAAYLQAQGVKDPSTAAAIVKHVGGVPLSLKLAASVVVREGGSDRSLEGMSGKSKFWFSATDEVIQGELFSRIIGHIHDPAVQRIAHPGLVLRRISPALILNVLNEPCVLAINTLQQATELFEKLRLETSLVVADTSDGTVVHRTDLRRIMLHLLERKSPAQVATIHRNARDWYSRQTGWRAKAEELYHRLQLGEFPDDPGFQHPETRSSLQFSISELPPNAQRYLATLGYQVSDEILAKASVQEREAYTAGQVEELLPYGSKSTEHARIILEDAPLPDRSSALFRARARVAAQQERYADAARLVETGLRHAFSEGQSKEALDLLCEQAWLLRLLPELGDLQNSLQLLAAHAERFADATAIFQHRTQLFELGAPNSQIASAFREITELTENMSSIDLWSVFPLLDPIFDLLWDQAPRAYARILTLIADLEGPFSRVELPKGNRRLSALLEYVSANLNLVEKVDIRIDKKKTNELLRRACEAWPYRVLRVKPPYSGLSRASFPSEGPVAA